MRCWMIRAGEGGRYFNEFIKHAVIAIGWEKIKDLKNIDTKTALTNGGFGVKATLYTLLLDTGKKIRGHP